MRRQQQYSGGVVTQALPCAVDGTAFFVDDYHASNAQQRGLT
jgi:hypothetical protein